MSCQTNVKYNGMLNCVSVHTVMEIYWILALLTTGRSLDFLLMQLHIFSLLFKIISLVYIYIYCICIYICMCVCMCINNVYVCMKINLHC